MRRPRNLRVALSLLAALAMGGLSMSVASASTPAPGSAAQVKALVASSVKITKLSAKLAAKLPTVPSDDAGLVFHIPDECVTATTCVYGDPAGTQTVVLFGDSHARMWLPAINPAALKAHVRLILLSVHGCLVIGGLTGSNFGGCRDLRVSAINLINSLQPVAVLLSNRTTGGSEGNAAWQSQMAATLTALAPSHAKLVIVGDVQAFGTPVPNCLAAFASAVQKCSIANPNKSVRGHEIAERAAAAAAKVRYVDPTPWLCAKRCSPVVGSFIAYWDTNHVTASYAAYLSRVMGAALASSL